MKLHSSFSKKIIFYLFVSFFSFHNVSFGQDYYIPNDAHLLALNQRNDFHFSGATNASFDLKKTINLQLAYSPIKHIGLSSSYFKHINLQNNPTILEETNYKNWDIAIGGYFFFPYVKSTEYNSEIKNHYNFFSEQNLAHESGVGIDFYLGHGQGDIRSTYQQNGRSNFQFKKTYLQLGLHGTIKFIGFQFAFRRGRLNYVDALVHGGPNLKRYLDGAIEVLDSNNNMDFTEQVIRAHGGIKYGQIWFSFSRIKNNNSFIKLGVKNHITTMGLKIDIDEFFRKSKKAN